MTEDELRDLVRERIMILIDDWFHSENLSNAYRVPLENRVDRDILAIHKFRRLNEINAALAKYEEENDA